MGYPMCMKEGCHYTLSAEDELINYETGTRGSGSFSAGLAHKVCPKDRNIPNPETWGISLTTHNDGVYISCGACHETLAGTDTNAFPTCVELIRDAVIEHLRVCPNLRN